jgi:hypothetical protein
MAKRLYKKLHEAIFNTDINETKHCDQGKTPITERKPILPTSQLLQARSVREEVH